MSLKVLLKQLIYSNLLETANFSFLQKEGEKHEGVGKLLNPSNFDKLDKDLNAQAMGEVLGLVGSSIFEIFSRICQELEIPAKLLVRNNFPETLSNVFLFIIHLSHSIRLMDPQKEQFLEKLQSYRKIANVLCNVKIDQYLFEDPSDLERFFQLVDEQLTASGKPSLANHDVSSLNELFISPDFVFAGFFQPSS